VKNLTVYALLTILLSSTTTFAHIVSTFNFDLDVEAGLSGSPGPYGTVDVELLDNTARITFNADSDYQFLGAPDAIDFNVNASSWTISNLSTGLSNTGPGIVGTFGVFDQTLSASGSAGSFSFTVNNTSGTWLSATDVIAQNSAGLIAAGNVIKPNSGARGFVAGPGNGIPAPPTPTPITLAQYVGFSQAAYGNPLLVAGYHDVSLSTLSSTLMPAGFLAHVFFE